MLLGAKALSPDAAHGNTTAIEVAADPPDAWAALLSVTTADVRLTRLLLGIRTLSLASFGADAQPLMDLFTGGMFTLLERDDEVPGLTVGVIGQFWKIRNGEHRPIADLDDFVAFEDAGWVKVTMDFRIDPVAPGRSRILTETRAGATDPESAAKFKRYWFVVAGGSKAIRVDMLRAVKRRCA